MPVIEAVVSTGLKGQGNVLILGVDMTGDRSLRVYDLKGDENADIDDPLIFVAQPDSLSYKKALISVCRFLAMDPRSPAHEERATTIVFSDILIVAEAMGLPC